MLEDVSNIKRVDLSGYLTVEKACIPAQHFTTDKVITCSWMEVDGCRDVTGW